MNISGPIHSMMLIQAYFVRVFPTSSVGYQQHLPAVKVMTSKVGQDDVLLNTDFGRCRTPMGSLSEISGNEKALLEVSLNFRKYWIKKLESNAHLPGANGVCWFGKRPLVNTAHLESICSQLDDIVQ